ncbi:MAG: electron transport complex subunit RsxC [Xanthomonadales bacterium]|nr:electron transport complex subunit RsxC [Xanthomonadales bacterium]
METDRRTPLRPGRFHGGLVLDGHKIAPHPDGLLVAPIPDQLVIPVTQHLGEAASPCVSVGDQVKRGQPITQGGSLVSAPVHASTSGEVVAIEDRPVPGVPTVSPLSIVIEPDGRDEPFPGMEGVADYREEPPHDLLDRVRRAGIVGLGGAAFPSHVKLNVPPSFSCDVLVLNGAECEPYISCDMGLMCDRAEEVITGAQIMMFMLGVTRCLIAIERDKTDALSAMKKVLEEEGDDRLELIAIDPVYPTGGEKQLIKVLLDREVPSGGLPIDVGCVCHNVGTAYAVKQAIVDGLPLVQRVVTVNGPGVRQPRNLLVRLGTPVRVLIEQCGGYADDVGRLLMGGSMMGIALSSDEVPVVKGCNCILALPSQELRTLDDELPCIRCSNCALVCPASLLPQQLHWYAKADKLDRVQDYSIFDCIECGCCDLVCPSHIPLAQTFRDAKADIWRREWERQKSERARERFEQRERRLAQEREELAARHRRREERRKRRK